MITKKCPHPCSTEYSFSEQDSEWGSLNTYCPKCQASPDVQYYQNDFNKRQKSLTKVREGLFIDKDGWYEVKLNGELVKSGVHAKE